MGSRLPVDFLGGYGSRDGRRLIKTPLDLRILDYPRSALQCIRATICAVPLHPLSPSLSTSNFASSAGATNSLCTRRRAPISRLLKMNA